MRIFKSPLALVLLLVSAASLTLMAADQAVISAQPHASVMPVPEGHRFPNGQVLHYDAEWRLWKSGVGTIRIDQTGELEHVTGVAESAGAVALLYRVQDRFESYFDRRTFCSLRIIKRAEEGLHRRETTLTFDSAHGRAVLDEQNLRSGERKHQESDTPGCVMDVLSGIYYLGAQHLQPNDTYRIPVNDGGKNFEAIAYVEGREDVKTDAGLFHTVRVAVYSDAGPLKGRGKVWIWYTNDPAHIPVQMRSRLFWGTLTLHLTRIDR